RRNAACRLYCFVSGSSAYWPVALLMRPVRNAYIERIVARSSLRTPGMVVVLKMPDTGSPAATPRLIEFGAPPIDSYIVVRRNVPPNVIACSPRRYVNVLETLYTGLFRGIGIWSVVIC